MTDKDTITDVTAKLLFPPGTRVWATLKRPGQPPLTATGTATKLDVLPGRMRVVMDNGSVWFPRIEDLEPL